ncbi:MAG: cell division protein FtsZ [Gammaproteobacteria bacterium]|nr:cell division protein FtsZ [Gammaproteobacteria bacterium]
MEAKEMNIRLVKSEPGSTPRLKVVGVGGAGGNAVNEMVKSHVRNVQFVAVNTDEQAMSNSGADVKLTIGRAVTQGMGAGSDPGKGREAALEDEDRLKAVMGGADMIFVAAGMGGGTGTGAGPEVARLGRECNLLVVGVVTTPFEFEGPARAQIADAGIAALREHAHSLITVPNEKLFEFFCDQGEGDVTMQEAFSESNKVLRNAVRGIAELLTCPGRINVDLADVRKVMREPGRVVIGAGEASGQDRAREALEHAMQSPLLQGVDVRDARGLLVNITHGNDLGMREFKSLGDSLQNMLAREGMVKFGEVVNESMKGAVRVTLVATGLSAPEGAREEAAQAGGTVRRAEPRGAGDFGSAQDGPGTGAKKRSILGLSQKPSYEGLERPAVMRVRAGAGGGGRGSEAFNPVPTHLRKQVD